MIPFILGILLNFIAAILLFGQTCSCGSAAMNNNPELKYLPAGSFNLKSSVRSLDISDLVSGSSEIDNEGRSQQITMLVLEGSFAFNERLNLYCSIHFVERERSNKTNNETTTKLTTSGLGDVTGMLIYRFPEFGSSENFGSKAGLGIRIPTGQSRLKSDGVNLPADLQPGTGSWGGTLAYFLDYQIGNRVLSNVEGSALYSFSGNSQHIGSTEYRYGENLLLTAFAISTLFRNVRLESGVQFRQAAANSLDGVHLPNSGGVWLDYLQRLEVNFAESLLLQLELLVPVYRNLKGIQLTTTSGFSIGLSYIFPLNNIS